MFAKRYCDGHKNDYGYWVTAGASNVEELSLQLQGIMLRRKKEEVLHLPATQRMWIDVDVPEATRTGLNQAVASFLAGEERTARGGRAGISLVSGARRRLAEVKVRQTIEYVQGAVDQGEKVILYSCFTRATRRFEVKFGDQAVAITGEVPTHKRQAIIDRFKRTIRSGCSSGRSMRPGSASI